MNPTADGRGGGAVEHVVGVVDGGDPARAVGRLAHHDAWHEQLSRCIGPEGERAERDRPSAGNAHFVHALDRRQQVLDLGNGAAGRDAAPGHTDAVADEQQAVAARHGVEVDLVVEGAGERLHRRVAVSNCVMPPDRRRRPTEEKPASASAVTRSSAEGR